MGNHAPIPAGFSESKMNTQKTPPARTHRITVGPITGRPADNKKEMLPLST
jgi:hypothetical protein